MAIEFRVRADVTDVEQKLQSLPAKAAAAGRKVNDGLSGGLRGSSSTPYTERMRAGMAKALSDTAAIEKAAMDKKRMREQAENARAQAELDKYNEAKARAAERAAEKEQKAKEKVYAPKTGGNNLLQNFVSEQTAATIAVGGFVANQIISAARQYAEIQNQMTANGGGLSRELAEQARSWRDMASSASEVSERMALQVQMSSAIQGEMDKMRADPGLQSNTENMFDMFQRLTGGETIDQNRVSASQSRIAALEKMAASNSMIAKRNQAEIEGVMNGNDAEGRESVFGNQIANLRGENEGLDLNDPAQLRRAQRNEAKIQGLIKYRDAARSMVDAERRQQESLLSPMHRRERIMENIGKLQERLHGATNAERVEIEKQTQQLQIQAKQASIAAVEQELQLGLSGPNARREAFREMRRERRELSRMARMAEAQARDPRNRDARAFTRQLMARDRMVELSQAAIVALNKPVEAVNDTLKDRLRPTKL